MDQLHNTGILVMQVWAKNTKFIDILQIYQKLANSNTTKEALNCTASIAADSIVNSISFITGLLFCDPKISFSLQIRLRFRPDLSSQTRPDPAPVGFEKVKSGATLVVTFRYYGKQYRSSKRVASK